MTRHERKGDVLLIPALAVLLLVATAGCSTPSYPSEVVLACKLQVSSEVQSGTLLFTLDEANGYVLYGNHQRLQILANSEEFITAFGQHNPSAEGRPENPGGIVLVYEKATGRFAFGEPVRICSSPACVDPKLVALYGSGKCER